jgi:putative YhbY family RNA-binding protein
MAMKPARRSELRSQAHNLSPVVIIGDKKGLTDEVLAEIDRSLKAHELIKIRAATDDRDARELWLEKICERLDAHAIQQIGKILVVYRENPDVPEKTAAAEVEPVKRSGTDDPRKRKRAEEKRKLETATRTSRPRSRTPSPRPESGPRRRRRNTSL